MSKKIVLKVQFNCEKCKQRVMKTVAGVHGVDSLQVDSKDGKITVIGDADPVVLTGKLRRFGSSEIVSVGPAKEEKKDDKKKDEPKKEEKKDDKKNISTPPSNVVVYVPPSWDPYYYGGYNYCFSDENPNACAIC